MDSNCLSSTSCVKEGRRAASCGRGAKRFTDALWHGKGTHPCMGRCVFSLHGWMALLGVCCMVKFGSVELKALHPPCEGRIAA